MSLEVQQRVTVIVSPSPFSTARQSFEARPGASIADMIDKADIRPVVPLRVCLDDVLIPARFWRTIRPKPGHLVTIRAIPSGGGGTKDILNIVASMVFPPYGAYYGLTQAGVPRPIAGILVAGPHGLTVSGLHDALVPPPLPRFGTSLGTDVSESPSFSITGGQNRALPYGVVPRAYGRIRMFPPYAARAYTEIVGDDQYLRMLFCLGPGPLVISELKIGDDPLSTFAGVESEVRPGFTSDPPFTLFTQSIIEDPLSIALTQAAGWQQRASQANASELSVDITFPGGLVDFDTAGNPGNRTVAVSVEYRKVGAGGWTSLDQAAVKAAVETDWTGTNNDLRFEAVTAGQAGNNLAVWFILNDALGQVTVSISGQTIIIEYLTASTAGQILTAVQAHAGASALVTVANKTGNNGTGTLPSLSQPVFLSGGREATTSFQVTNKSRMPVRRSLRWPVADGLGLYEIRLQRTTADTTDPTITDLVFWTALRTIRQAAPLIPSGMAGIALRIKATDQLNGIVDALNCVVESILPDWNGSSWVRQITNNPASIYRDILQGSANARPLTDARLHLTDLQAWHAECAAAGRAWNGILDTRTTVFEALRQVVAIGRGSFAMKDGKYSVVRDLAQTVPIQHFGLRNSWGFRATRTFPDMPHALKIRFINPETDWQEDERIVYDDGFSAANATKFEALELPGCTDKDLAWKLGRYHLAVLRLRPEVFELMTDIENLRCTRADLVRVVHDVPLFGLGSGRVKSLVTDGGGNVTSVTLDEAIVMVAGKTYALRFRRSGWSSVLATAVTVPGEQTTVGLSPSIPAASAPAVGDFVLFGEAGKESVELLVKAIVPMADLTAKLILVDAAPGVLTADSGAIPPYSSQITVPAASQALKPSPPIIDQVRSDESVLVRDIDGSLQSQILILVSFVSGTGLPADSIQVRFKPTGSAAGFLHLSSVVQGTSAQVGVQPVEDGISYDLYVRSVHLATGATSDWTPILQHTVIGKSTPPPNVPVLLLDGDFLRWSYPDPPRDFAGFRVKARAGSDIFWDEGVPLHDTLVTDTRFPIIQDGLLKTYMIKAVDTAGNESLTPAAFVDVGTATIVLGNLAETIDLKAQGFPGTIVNGTVVGGNLTADGATLFWTNDEATFWALDSGTFWTGSYKTMTYTFTVSPPLAWLSGKLRLSMVITAGLWTLTFRPDVQTRFWTADSALFWTTDAAIFWTGTKPDFMAWPGAIGPMSRQVYEFQLVANGGLVQGVVSLLKVLFDMPDLVESFNNLAVPATGLRLPITKTYSRIKSVQLTLDDDGGAGRFPMALDKDYIAGPLVEVNDVNNVPVAGVVDADVVGY